MRASLIFRIRSNIISIRDWEWKYFIWNKVNPLNSNCFICRTVVGWRTSPLSGPSCRPFSLMQCTGWERPGLLLAGRLGLQPRDITFVLWLCLYCLLHNCPIMRTLNPHHVQFYVGDRASHQMSHFWMTYIHCQVMDTAVSSYNVEDNSLTVLFINSCSQKGKCNIWTLLYIVVNRHVFILTAYCLLSFCRDSMAMFDNLWETFPDENCVLTNRELLVEVRRFPTLHC